MSARAEQAEQFFREGYNCAQAVAAAFDDVTGYDRETLLKASCAFGGGFAGSRNICGAVSAMGIVTGLAKADGSPAAKRAVYPLVQDLNARFASQLGSIVCADLLANAAPHGKRCADCVRLAAQLLEETLCAE